MVSVNILALPENARNKMLSLLDKPTILGMREVNRFTMSSSTFHLSSDLQGSEKIRKFINCRYSKNSIHLFSMRVGIR